MSRYCGSNNSVPVLEAVTKWKDRALLHDGSVFTDRTLWTVAGLEALERYFVQNLDEGSASFISKLQGQIAPTSPEVKQLASEMLWLMFLSPSNVGAAKKRTTIAEVWGWSGEGLPVSAAPFLTDDILRGIGSGGPGFANHRWRELTFCINVMLALKRLPVAKRQGLADDGWAFAEWLEGVPDSGARQLRHMLLFLLFPDDFERIFGRGDRRAVAIAFGGIANQAVNAMSPIELDRTLRRVRTELEAKFETRDLDFYEPPLAGRWKAQDFRATTQAITADHVLRAIAEVDERGVPPGAESTGYDLLYAGKRYPPKLILSLAAKHANGTEFDRSQFTGGEDSSAFRLLRSLGFEITAKALLTSLLGRFLEQAAAASNLAVSGYPEEYRGLQIKVSFGKGVQARIPWVAFLGPGHSPTQGSYPVLLYYRDAKALIVAYGISETHDTPSLWRNLESAETIEAYLPKRFGREPERYGESFVAAGYSISDALDVEQVARDIDGVIDRYKPLLVTVTEPAAVEDIEPEDEIYTLEDAVEGLFIDQAAFGEIVKRLRTKHNLILQGPPGVGKTFFAKRLAFALLGSRDKSRVSAVQFHQTYSYEDFVQGYRPSGTGFSLKNGVFYTFCRRAAADLERDYVL